MTPPPPVLSDEISEETLAKVRLLMAEIDRENARPVVENGVKDAWGDSDIWLENVEVRR